MDVQDVWSTILPQLELSLSPGKFATWVTPIKALDLKEVDNSRSILELGFPSVFHKNQVEDKYLGQIQQLAEIVIGKKCEVQLSIRQEKTETNKTEGGLFSVNVEKIATEAYEGSVYRTGLNAHFTFDNFAVSSSNEVAHAAAKAVAKQPGQMYHLLFIYGGVGVGKTHLMQAAGHEILRKNPDTRLVYCTGEEFTNEIIEAIRGRSTANFRQKYRKAKALLLDDVQFIGGKDTVQEEFFHTFNAINKEGGQVILTSDRLPREIVGLEDRLRSRFEGGLTVDVQEPTFELRAAILLIKAQQLKINLPIRVAQAIAANIVSVRGLEGFLLKINSEQLTRKEPLTEEFALALLGKITGEVDNHGPRLSANQVVKEVADFYQIKTSDLKGERRQKKIVMPRQIAMYLLRKELQIPLVEAGQVLGGRDHSTIIHGSDKISAMVAKSETLRLDIAAIRKKLYAGG